MAAGECKFIFFLDNLKHLRKILSIFSISRSIFFKAVLIRCLELIALASYIPPQGADNVAMWNRIMSYDKVGILVANVMNGPGNVVDTDWSSIITEGHGKGKKVIGYVRTGYLGVSDQKYQTRLGSTSLQDCTSQILTDVDLWYQ